MMEVIVAAIFIGIVAGVVAGIMLILYSRHMHFKRINRMLMAANGMLEALEESVIDTRIEFDDNIMRAYNMETDEFLAQGKTWDELNSVLRNRFPDKMFNVKQDQIDKAVDFGK